MNSVRSAYHYLFGPIPLPPAKYHCPPPKSHVLFSKAVGCVAWLWVMFHFKTEGAVLFVSLPWLPPLAASFFLLYLPPCMHRASNILGTAMIGSKQKRRKELKSGGLNKKDLPEVPDVDFYLHHRIFIVD